MPAVHVAALGCRRSAMTRKTGRDRLRRQQRAPRTRASGLRLRRRAPIGPQDADGLGWPSQYPRHSALKVFWPTSTPAPLDTPSPGNEKNKETPTKPTKPTRRGTGAGLREIERRVLKENKMD